MMKTKFPEGSNFGKTKNLSKKWLICLFEPEKLKNIKIRWTKVVRNIKNAFLRSKFQKKIIEKSFFKGPQTLPSSTRFWVSIWMILYSTTWLFLVRIWVVNMKTKKIANVFEPNSILSQKTVKNPVFLRFFYISISGCWYLCPEFQKLVEQKLFAIMKGNFSALAVKRIRVKSKNNPPYLVITAPWR
jgi:hypothetical protein